jgi:hypothetical protein
VGAAAVAVMGDNDSPHDNPALNYLSIKVNTLHTICTDPKSDGDLQLMDNPQ